MNIGKLYFLFREIMTFGNGSWDELGLGYFPKAFSGSDNIENLVNLVGDGWVS